MVRVHDLLVLQDPPGFGIAFVKGRTAGIVLQEHRFDAHGPGQAQGAFALVGGAVDVQGSIGIAVQVQHQVVLEGVLQQLDFAGTDGVQAPVLFQQLGKAALGAGHVVGGQGLIRQARAQGWADFREIAVEVLAVLQVEAPGQVPEYALTQAHRIGKGAHRDIAPDPAVPFEGLQPLQQVLDDQQARVLVGMQSGLDIDAAALGTVGAGEGVAQQAVTGAGGLAGQLDFGFMDGHVGPRAGSGVDSAWICIR